MLECLLFLKAACTKTVHRIEVFRPCTKGPKHKPVATLALLAPYASTSNLGRVLLCSYLFITDRATEEKEGKQEYAVFADRKRKKAG